MCLISILNKKRVEQHELVLKLFSKKSIVILSASFIRYECACRNMRENWTNMNGLLLGEIIMHKSDIQCHIAYNALILLCLSLCIFPSKGFALPKENKTKIVIVTGASRGVGRALVEELLLEKIKVIAIVREQKSLNTLLQKYPEQLQVIESDLSIPKEQTNIIEKINEPVIHYLVHNAGIIEPLGTQAFLEAKPEVLRKIFEVNVMAPILLTNALGSKLKEGSRILNISSVAGDKATAGLGAYCVTKVALDRFSESLQLDRPHGVLSTSVHPGRVDTGMQVDLRNHVSKDFVTEKYVKYKNENRLIAPKKVAKYLKWLLISSSDTQFLKKKHDMEDQSHHIYWDKGD